MRATDALAVFEPGGARRETAPLRVGDASAFAVSRSGRYRYVAVADPHPQVVQYALDWSAR